MGTANPSFLHLLKIVLSPFLWWNYYCFITQILSLIVTCKNQNVWVLGLPLGSFSSFDSERKPAEQSSSSPPLWASLLAAQRKIKERMVFKVSSLHLAVSLSISIGFTEKITVISCKPQDSPVYNSLTSCCCFCATDEWTQTDLEMPRSLWPVPKLFCSSLFS